MGWAGDRRAENEGKSGNPGKMRKAGKAGKSKKPNPFANVKNHWDFDSKSRCPKTIPIYGDQHLGYTLPKEPLQRNIGTENGESKQPV